MQDIIFEDPYEFIPPDRGLFWLNLIQRFKLYNPWLRRVEGVTSWETRDAEKIRASLDAGFAVILAPNHCRAADPLAMGYLAGDADTPIYAMAGWHLFKQSWFMGWAIRRMGGFSVYREGVDRQAIHMAIEILRTAERPLVIFPEGIVSRTNDRLHAMLDGVAFIARTGAKRRAKEVPGPAGKVVIHPVAIKYLFRGDLRKAATPVLARIEKRLAWHTQDDLPLVPRIAKVGMSLLALKELEYFGETLAGSLAQRLDRLVNRMLTPLEEEWLGAPGEGPAPPRVKALRFKILPDMVQRRIDDKERARRWRQLEVMYLAQQVSCYWPDYLEGDPTVERLLETVERFEEDLTDKCTVHGNLHVILEAGDPIEVSPDRPRGVKTDPLMTTLRDALQGMLDELAKEGTVWREK